MAIIEKQDFLQRGSKLVLEHRSRPKRADFIV